MFLFYFYLFIFFSEVDFLQKLRNSTGWISSPYNNDGLYDNYLNGYWVIYAGDNEITELIFVEMDIEFDEWCRFDYLDVSLLVLKQGYILLEKIV